MHAVIDRVKYDTEKATLLADNRWADGRNELPGGRAAKLYRTLKGRYFLVSLTCWQDESDRITPLALEEAEEEFGWLPNQHVSHEEAFPGVEVEEA